MDESGNRENGRHKPPQGQGQWLMHNQPSMKHIMAIMTERDAAIQERNLAISEKKAALSERDIAILQRDSAISERNKAIIERDNAIATLHYRDNAINGATNFSPCPPGCQISRGLKHMHHPHMTDMHVNQTIPVPEQVKSKRTKRTKETKEGTSVKKAVKSSKKVKREVTGKSQEWKSNETMEELGLGLNQVAFDDSTMPVPVCSCTGTIRACYKWGNGGWQSSCCTTNMSMYPLPAMPNKRHARIGGRKMSGSAFTKLLNRLVSEGHRLSDPVDLKDNWAKHGTNRYITIK